jgi:hypothetical protein
MMPRFINAFAAPACAVAALAACPATGQVFDLLIDPNTSHVNGEVDVASPIAGTFIGDYDAVENPDGTRTLPGIFGGSGNQPIPYTATLSGGGPFDSQPAGNLTIDVDVDALTISVTGLLIDALSGAGQDPAFDAMLSITFSTFRTFNPDSLYPGGTLPLPLGQLTVHTLTIMQDGAAIGTLTPARVRGQSVYDFAVGVPVIVHIQGNFAGDPVDLVMPTLLGLTGTLTIDDEWAVMTIAFDVAAQETDNGPFPPFEGVPVDVPTILPPGETAHLLFSGQVQSITISYVIAGDIVAAGQTAQAPITGDLNGDGVVDVLDLLILLDAWGACGDCSDCLADLNGDCTVDVLDLLVLLDNWG